MAHTMAAGPKSADAPPSPVPGNPGAEQEIKPPWRKILFLAIIVAAALAIAYLSPLREYLGRWQEVSQQVRRLGWLAPLVLTPAIAILVSLGFPRLLFCVIAGMSLGFWSGLLWAQLGTLLGNYVIFVVARRGGRGWAERYLSKRGRLHSLVQQESILGVILARQLPVPGLLVNLTCGLLPIRHRHFLLGTIIGQLPEAIPCTLIGAGALEPSFAKSAGLIGLAVFVAVVVWVGLRFFLRRQRAGRRQPSPAATPPSSS